MRQFIVVQKLWPHDFQREQIVRACLVVASVNTITNTVHDYHAIVSKVLTTYLSLT